jgi:hypothetical protein
MNLPLLKPGYKLMIYMLKATMIKQTGIPAAKIKNQPNRSPAGFLFTMRD